MIYKYLFIWFICTD